MRYASRHCLPVWVALSAVALPTAGAGAAAPRTADESPPSLPELVEAFFRAENHQQRAAIARSVEEAAGGDPAAVATAMSGARLWPALRGGDGVFAVELRGSVSVAYRLPVEYDPTKRHALVLCLPDRRESPGRAFDRVRKLCGDAIHGSVMVCPAPYVGGAFQQPSDAAAELASLMRELRRRFHLDTDRAYLFGTGAGADAAWIVAIMHADLFAGVFVSGGYPRVPYPEQVYAFLLKNLQRLPVLSTWVYPDDQATARQRAVANHNRAILAIAKQASLPIVGIELPNEEATATEPLFGELRRLLQNRRPPATADISHWFRYPGQGVARWLRQTRFLHEVWETEQLSILPSETTDRVPFIREVIQEKLGYLGGRLDGEGVRIEARNCARIELLLPVGVAEPGQPLTVWCNGKKRYHDAVRPDIPGMLEAAYENWDLQRVPVARLSFSIKRDRKASGPSGRRSPPP